MRVWLSIIIPEISYFLSYAIDASNLKPVFEGLIVKTTPKVVIMTSGFNLVHSSVYCYPWSLFSDWDSNPLVSLGGSSFYS